MKKYIVKVNRLSAEGRAEVMEAFGGAYLVRFIGTTTDRLQRASKGFSDEGLSALLGRYVLCSTSHAQDGTTRLIPISAYLPRAVASLLNSRGSFSYHALGGVLSITPANVKLQTKFAFCSKCGKWLSEAEAEVHDCSRPPRHLCTNCGTILKSKAEKERGVCKECAKKLASHLYGYHSRPHLYDPIFEKGGSRTSSLHLGVELEVDGKNTLDRVAFCREVNDALNKDPFTPFVEFETDGSIRNGVECIFAPTTFEGLKKHADGFQRLYDRAYNFGGGFSAVNGLHFHLDNKYFGSGDKLYKARVSIETLIYKYFGFFSYISGRPAGSFGYAHKKAEVNDLLTASRFHRDRSHSDAVNCSNDHTTELRIFGGYITNASDFFAVADIAQAVARWAKASSLNSVVNASPSSIVRYLKTPDAVADFIEKAPTRARELNYTLPTLSATELAQVDAFVKKCKGVK